MKNKLPNLTLIEKSVWVTTKSTGFNQYDYDFEACFSCTHPYQIDGEMVAIARMGAAKDYTERYEEMLEWGIRLINTPEEYKRSSFLPHWYPLISEYTPRSICYDSLPTVEQILSDFKLPIFIKGERQTNKHSAQSVIRTKQELVQMLEDWQRESILWWQRVVCREFIELEPVVKVLSGGELQKSYEFRTFWYRGRLVGCGKYWIAADYKVDDEGLTIISEIGEKVNHLLKVPFLVIDFAKTLQGKWIVIECNDGQDSGYAGVDTRLMWQKIVDIEKGMI